MLELVQALADDAVGELVEGVSCADDGNINFNQQISPVRKRGIKSVAMAGVQAPAEFSADGAVQSGNPRSGHSSVRLGKSNASQPYIGRAQRHNSS